MAKTPGMNAVLERMRKTVEEGNFYEAQQLIKTLYFRYTTQNKVSEAKEILINGACTMLKANQSTCASELGQMLLKLYSDSHVKADTSAVESVTRIASLFPAGDQGKISLLKSALKWSVAEGAAANNNNTTKQGDPNLHAQLAKAYYEADEYPYAQKHYLKSNQPKEFGQMLIDWANEGYSSERDLYIARAVLMYLSLSNLRDANVIYQIFTNSLQPNQFTPLLHYLKFLLLTLERDAYPLFDVLRQKYKPSLSRDPSFSPYLDHIAQIYYRVKPPTPAGGPAGFGNLFSDLFKSFMPTTATNNNELLGIDAEDAD